MHIFLHIYIYIIVFTSIYRRQLYIYVCVYIRYILCIYILSVCVCVYIYCVHMCVIYRQSSILHICTQSQSTPHTHIFVYMCVYVCMCVHTKLLHSCLTLQPYGLQPMRLFCPWDSPGKNTGVGCHALLQGIFPTQASNPCFLCLLHCKWVLYSQCHLGSLYIHAHIYFFHVSIYFGSKLIFQFIKPLQYLMLRISNIGNRWQCFLWVRYNIQLLISPCMSY